MRVYRAIVNTEYAKGDVIHYIIKDGLFFFSEADLVAKARIYGRSNTENVEIPVGSVIKFISMDRVKDQYPDILNLAKYRDSEVQSVAKLAERNHGKGVISFSVDEALIEIIE